MDGLTPILMQKGYEVFTVRPETTVLEAVDEMCRARVGALVVVDRERPVGILGARSDDPCRPSRTRPGQDLGGGRHEREAASGDAQDRAARGHVAHDRVARASPPGGRRRSARGAGVSIGDLVRWSVGERDRLIEELQRYCAGSYP